MILVHILNFIIFLIFIPLLGTAASSFQTLVYGFVMIMLLALVERLRMTVKMQHVSNSYIGAMCSEYRRYILKVSQKQVALDCGCSRESVSKFERGAIANSRVFLWYIKNGIFDWVSYEKWNGWEMYLSD